MESSRGNRVEIDTSAPFRSVKEAVMLFGERVLVGEVYAKKLKENKKNEHGHVTAVSELEETKQTLQKAREESMQMAQFLSSLQQQLQQTKREIEHLKARDSAMFDPETEDLKYVENPKDKTEAPITNHPSVEFQKKKCVSFSNDPPVAHIVMPSSSPGEAHRLQRHPSLKKKKKKQFGSFMAGIFTKKKGSGDAALL